MTDSTTTRRQVLIGLGAAGAASLAGCNTGGGDGDGGGEPPTDTEMMETTEAMEMSPTPTASAGAVRVAHASPNAPNVDVYLDGNAVLEDVPFGAVSGYLEVPAGDHTVEITAAGDADTVVFSGDLPVEADTSYTVVAIGELGDDVDQEFRPLVLTDDRSDPGGDTARVELVHASPDAPAVDVTVEGGDTLFDGVAFGESGAVEVPAGEYTVQVRGDTESNDGDVVAEYALNLEGGQRYTALAAGYLTPGDDPADTPFDLFVALADGTVMSAPTPAPTATPTPSPTPTPSAGSLRVAHASPNAPNVDVYLDGNAALENVAFGAVSSYLGVPAGDHTVEITAAGDADTVVFSGEVTVQADTDYTVAAIGEVGDGVDEPFRPLVLTDDNSDPGSDTARVRLVHASPDAPAVDVTVASSGDALYDGVPFGGSGYVEVPGGDYTLEVRGDTESNDGDVVDSFDVSVSGGEVYTAFALGYLTPDDDPGDAAFTLGVVQDT